MSESDGPAVSARTAATEPMTLEGIVSALRQLAVKALDAGHPVAAAQVAGAADRVEAQLWPRLPQRPGYVPEGGKAGG